MIQKTYLQWFYFVKHYRGNIVKDVIPYNTGKVTIGLAYIPKPEYRQDYDAWCWQSVFLSKFKPRKFFNTKSNRKFIFI